MQPQPRKLLDQVRDVIRLKHYLYRTEESYVAWIRRYILFHNKRHPSEMEASENVLNRGEWEYGVCLICNELVWKKRSHLYPLPTQSTANKQLFEYNGDEQPTQI